MRLFNPSHPGRILAYYPEGRIVTEVARHHQPIRLPSSIYRSGKDFAVRCMAFGLTGPSGYPERGI